MLTLNDLTEAERFVARQQRLENDVWWEGFDKIVFFRASDKGRSSKHGAFYKGQWGFRNVSAVTPEGTWEIDHRNVRRSKRTRN
jgi:hypothetical protein